MTRISLALLAFSMTWTALGAGPIQWRDWSLPAFEEAAKQNKLIFVDVGMEGCTACRSMDEVTLTDKTVVALLNKDFVTIQVDAEARPDIGERYSDWAWPALIFMAPNTTQVLALRGNRLPRNFIPILNELVEKHAAGELEADALEPYAAPPAPIDTEMTVLRNRVRGQIDRVLNETDGGWSRRALSTASGARLMHLYFRAHMYGNDELEAIAIKTSDAFLRAIDPVWGGVFVSVILDSGRWIPEKRISNQASALHAFAEAFQLTGETRYANGLAMVDRYLGDWMLDTDGTFFTSQEDDPPGLTREVGTRAYWALSSDATRRAYGIPPIDHAVYTDKNGEVIAAYARAYEATGEQRYLDRAVTAAETILATRKDEAGWIRQATASELLDEDHRMRPHAVTDVPFLGAQAWFGTALLALHRVTGEPRWLAHALDVARAMRELLADDANGGFYATTPDATARVIGPRKPLELNARAAHFLYDLWVYSKDDSFAGVGEQTLRAAANPTVVRREGKVTGELALALEKLTAAYVEFSVVGDADDPRARALFAAGRATYHPRKLLHYEAPGRYPDRGRPAMYICNPDFCTIPIEEPNEVAAQAEQLRRPAVTQI